MDHRFGGKFSPLVFGSFDAATTGLEDFLCVDRAEHRQNMSKGVDGIVSEVGKMVADARARFSEMKEELALMEFSEMKKESAFMEQAEQLEECLHYVLHEEAGSSKVTFENGNLMRDCDKDGRLLPSREIVDPVTGQKRGMRLDDFVNHRSARLTGLMREHVLALRLYSTIAFRSINNPLRDQSRRAEGRAHPLPVTVTLIGEALRQLRKVESNSATAQDSVVLYRGLSRSCISPEFLDMGGTELAPMSTTNDLKVALQYSASEHSVILRFRSKDFMDRGVSIEFLSAFPGGTSEALFPPLTYLRPMRKEVRSGVSKPQRPQVVKVGDATFTFVDVQALV